ncbi:hypothetical protein, partial [Pseudomonas aeruginosa]|uniref:hypothetical protein n=1 Tax=Pseudomonas aeruginosa TaxID=287 RepID=UPI001C610F05
ENVMDGRAHIRQPLLRFGHIRLAWLSTLFQIAAAGAAAFACHHRLWSRNGCGWNLKHQAEALLRHTQHRQGADHTVQRLVAPSLVIP